MSDFKAKMHQIRFRLGLRPDPAWGAYSAPPDPLAGFKGPTFKGKGGEEMGGDGMGREGEGRGGRERGKGKEEEKEPPSDRSGYGLVLYRPARTR